MNDNLNNYEFAEFASSADALAGKEKRRLAPGQELINLQLEYWSAAVNIYEEKRENFTIEEYLVILLLLCHSLETSGGVNIQPREHTPPLLTLYEKTLPDEEEKQWNLKEEKPELFCILKEMITNHNNLCKHLNKKRTDKLSEMTPNKLSTYMEATRKMWLWALGKKYHDDIPEEQRKYFEKSFK